MHAENGDFVKNHPTYLVVADESEEFKTALRYACRLAAHRGCHLAIAHIPESEDFQDWGAVEAVMRRELRQQAEKFIWGIAGEAQAFSALTPSLYVGEGEKGDALIKMIEENEQIVALILGGRSSGNGGGPLVNYFAGTGTAKLPIPLILVPGHLDPDTIDAIT